MRLRAAGLGPVLVTQRREQKLPAGPRRGAHQKSALSCPGGTGGQDKALFFSSTRATAQAARAKANGKTQNSSQTDAALAFPFPLMGKPLPALPSAAATRARGLLHFAPPAFQAGAVFFAQRTKPLDSLRPGGIFFDTTARPPCVCGLKMPRAGSLPDQAPDCRYCTPGYGCHAGWAREENRRQRLQKRKEPRSKAGGLYVFPFRSPRSQYTIPADGKEDFLFV